MSNPNLRPLTFGEILDGAFALYRRNFTSFFLIALLPFLPVAAAWIALGVLLPATDEGAAAVGLAQVFLTPYSLLATVLVYGALVHQAASAYRGEPTSLRAGFAAAGRRYLPLLGVAILSTLLMLLGFVFLVVPGILVAIVLFGIFPVVMLENCGPVEALGRSRALARNAWGRIFGLMTVLVLIMSIPMMALGAASVIGIGVTAAPGGVAGGGLGFALTQILSTAGTALTTPLFTIGMLLLYYDRRVRAEGLDLELATEQLATAG